MTKDFYCKYFYWLGLYNSNQNKLVDKINRQMDIYTLQNKKDGPRAAFFIITMLDFTSQ